jgi:hypothetical protein
MSSTPFLPTTPSEKRQRDRVWKSNSLVMAAIASLNYSATGCGGREALLSCIFSLSSEAKLFI